MIRQKVAYSPAPLAILKNFKLTRTTLKIKGAAKAVNKVLFNITRLRKSV